MPIEETVESVEPAATIEGEAETEPFQLVSISKSPSPEPELHPIPVVLPSAQSPVRPWRAPGRVPRPSHQRVRSPLMNELNPSENSSNDDIEDDISIDDEDSNVPPMHMLDFTHTPLSPSALVNQQQQHQQQQQQQQQSQHQQLSLSNVNMNPSVKAVRSPSAGTATTSLSPSFDVPPVRPFGTSMSRSKSGPSYSIPSILQSKSGSMSTSGVAATAATGTSSRLSNEIIAPDIAEDDAVMASAGSLPSTTPSLHGSISLTPGSGLNSAWQSLEKARSDARQVELGAGQLLAQLDALVAASDSLPGTTGFVIGKLVQLSRQLLKSASASATASQMAKRAIEAAREYISAVASPKSKSPEPLEVINPDPATPVHAPAVTPVPLTVDTSIASEQNGSDRPPELPQENSVAGTYTNDSAPSPASSGRTTIHQVVRRKLSRRNKSPSSPSSIVSYDRSEYESDGDGVDMLEHQRQSFDNETKHLDDAQAAVHRSRQTIELLLESIKQSLNTTQKMKESIKSALDLTRGHQSGSSEQQPAVELAKDIVPEATPAPVPTAPETASAVADAIEEDSAKVVDIIETPTTPVPPTSANTPRKRKPTKLRRKSSGKVKVDTNAINKPAKADLKSTESPTNGGGGGGSNRSFGWYPTSLARMMSTMVRKAFGDQEYGDQFDAVQSTTIQPVHVVGGFPTKSPLLDTIEQADEPAPASAPAPVSTAALDDKVKDTAAAVAAMSSPPKETARPSNSNSNTNNNGQPSKRSLSLFGRSSTRKQQPQSGSGSSKGNGLANVPSVVAKRSATAVSDQNPEPESSVAKLNTKRSRSLLSAINSRLFSHSSARRRSSIISPSTSPVISAPIDLLPAMPSVTRSATADAVIPETAQE